MKRFTSFFICSFIAFPVFHSCLPSHWKEVKGNYHIVNEKIAIPDYDEITVNISADVVYRQIAQDEPFLQVSVDANILPLLNISVKNHRLIIDQTDDSIIKPSKLVIYTNSRNLEQVKITGSGNVLLANEVNAKEMKLSIIGSGDVKTDSLYCKELEVKITGSGDVLLNGAATSADFRISGSGNIRAFNYAIEDLDCRISGSGDIEALVLRELKASISGSGDIRYKGHPKSVHTSVSGSGDIIQIN